MENNEKEPAYKKRYLYRVEESRYTNGLVEKVRIGLSVINQRRYHIADCLMEITQNPTYIVEKNAIERPWDISLVYLETNPGLRLWNVLDEGDNVFLNISLEQMDDEVFDPHMYDPDFTLDHSDYCPNCGTGITDKRRVSSSDGRTFCSVPCLNERIAYAKDTHT